MSRFLHLAKRITNAAHTLYAGVPASSPITLTGTAPTGNFRCSCQVSPRPYYQTSLTGTHNDILWADAIHSDARCSIEYTSTAGHSLAITVTGDDIVVDLATTALGAITTTANDIIALAALNASLIALGVTASLKTGDNGTGVVTVLGHVHFTSGLDVVGTVTIATETITYTVAATKTTTVSLTSLPAVSYANIDCKITIKCINSGGAPLFIETETNLPCKIEVKTKNIPSPTGGWTSIQATEMQARGTFAIDDIVKFDIDNPFDPTDGIEYQIVAIRPKVGYMGKENIKILTF